MQEFKIFPMNLEDLELIKDTLLSDFDEFWTYDILKTELLSSNSKYIVVRNKDNNIVGFAGVKIILDEAEIMNIVTKKSERNLGIASLMLSFLIKQCLDFGINKINLEVNCKNTVAINLYKKYNFAEVGLRKKYYDNTDDAVLMTLFRTNRKVLKFTKILSFAFAFRKFVLRQIYYINLCAIFYIIGIQYDFPII